MYCAPTIKADIEIRFGLTPFILCANIYMKDTYFISTCVFFISVSVNLEKISAGQRRYGHNYKGGFIIKKLISLVLALCCIFSLGVTSFATEVSNVAVVS